MQLLWKVIYNDNYLSIDIEKNIHINSCLSTDMDLHNGEKPILCKFCDKTFSDESYLTDHMGIHRDCNPISYRYNTEEELCQFTSCNKYALHKNDSLNYAV